MAIIHHAPMNSSVDGGDWIQCNRTPSASTNKVKYGLTPAAKAEGTALTKD